MFREVVGSLQWVKIGLPAPQAGPEGPWPQGPSGPGLRALGLVVSVRSLD